MALGMNFIVSIYAANAISGVTAFVIQEQLTQVASFSGVVKTEHRKTRHFSETALNHDMAARDDGKHGISDVLHSVV